jgi:hypothetical protein
MENMLKHVGNPPPARFIVLALSDAEFHSAAFLGDGERREKAPEEPEVPKVPEERKSARGLLVKLAEISGWLFRLKRARGAKGSRETKSARGLLVKLVEAGGWLLGRGGREIAVAASGVLGSGDEDIAWERR